MKGDLTCVGGRLMRHDPQDDDPYLETDVGEYPDCSGDGCGDWNGDYREPVSKVGRTPPELDAMADKVLAYRPKPKSEAAKSRKRKAAKVARKSK